MNFKEAEGYYKQLKSQLNSNTIDYEQFKREVDKLCIQTNDQTWWRIRAQDGVWLRWDGKQWLEYKQEDNTNQNNTNQSQDNKSQKSKNQKQNINRTENSRNTQHNESCSKEKLPETFVQLLVYIIKKLPATLIKQLPMAIGVGLTTWVIHTILLIGPNGGFNPGPYVNLSQILALKGNKISGSLFWFFASMGTTMILKQVLSGNTMNLVNQIITTPKYIFNTIKKGGNIEKIVTSLSCAVALFISIRFGNKYLNLVTGSVLYMALQSWRRNFLFIIFKYIWSDIQRWFFSKNKKIEINYNVGASAYSGITLGFFIAGIFGNYAIVVNMLVIGLVAFVVYLMSDKNKKPTATMMMIICGSMVLHFFSNEYVVFADDGGYQEAGGSLLSWIQSQGASIAILMGLFPGLAAILSSLLSSLGLEITDLFPDDFTTDQTTDETTEENTNDKKVWIEIIANPKGIKADGAEVSWVYAKVCTSDPEIDATVLTSGISFDTSGEYSYLLRIGQAQFTTGYKAVNISANVNPNESYPPSASVTIIASVNSSEGSISKSTTLSLELPGELKLEMATNPEKRAIVPDGKTGIWVYARPVPSGNNMDVKVLNTILDSITFSPSGEGATWADLSEPTYSDNWRCVFVQASNPDARTFGYNQPKSFTISANAILGEKSLSGSISIEILPMPQLDVDNDMISLLSGSKGSVTIKATVNNTGADTQWKFRAVVKDMKKDLISISFDEEENTYAKITIEESGGSNNKGQQAATRGIITIYAECGEVSLERELKVYIASEGIFVKDNGISNNDGSFTIKADGESTIEIGFNIYLWDENKKELVSDKNYLDKLNLEFQTPESSKAFELNAYNIAKPEVNAIRIVDTSVSTGYYKIITKKEVPGDGKTAFIKINVSLSIGDKELSTVVVTLGLKTTDMGPGSEAWQVEYERCNHVIEKFVPTGYKDKLTEILEKRKMTLDAAGMLAMRKQIWKIAVLLMEGEGGQGYLEEAKWADRIVTVLEWWEWAGDMAFNAIAATFMGPIGALGAGVMKSMIISAIKAYQDGKSAGEWLWEQIKGFAVMGADMALDPERTEKAIGKARAWALFVCYKFIYGLYEGKSVKDAIYGAATAAGENVLGNWLNDKVKASAKENGYKVHEEGHIEGDENKNPKDNDGSKPKDGESSSEKNSNENTSSKDKENPKDGEGSKNKGDEKTSDKDKTKDGDGSEDSKDKPDDAKHKPKDKDSDNSKEKPKEDSSKDKSNDGSGKEKDKNNSDGEDPKGNKDKDDNKTNEDDSNNKENDNNKNNTDDSKNKDNNDTKTNGDDSKNKDNDDTKTNEDDSKKKDNDDTKTNEDDSKKKDNDDTKTNEDDSKKKDNDDKKNNKDDKGDDGNNKDTDTNDIKPGESKKIKTSVGEVTISKDADGKPYMSENDVLKIKQDTQASRSLKEADPAVREAYNNTLKEKVYDPHDKNLTDWIKNRIDNVDNKEGGSDPHNQKLDNWIKKNLGDVKDPEIKVDDFRTPGKEYDPTDVNTDRDYRVVYKDADGKWKEIPKENWKDQSMDEFAKSSGYSEERAKEALHSEKERVEFDKLSDQEKKEKWAEMHHQTPTDKSHVEASKDYSDQGVDWKTGEAVSEPNINKVRRGEAQLNDPQGLGNMFEEKVDIYTRDGNAPEALAQAKKAVTALNDVRDGYSKNYDIGNLPTRLKNGMEIISETKSDMSATPEYMQNVEKQLKEQGFKDIGDFMDKVSGQFASLKWAVKK